MKKEFEKELTKQGFLYQETADRYYNITPKNRIVLPTSVQLVISRPINEIIHGSQNGNNPEGIGHFLFNLNSKHDPDFYVFIFKNNRSKSAQYMIIPTNELRWRLKQNIIRYRSGENIELRLWLMDEHIYDISTFGCEGEWFYLSKGIGGRMIDSTIWNYTSFWNNWVLGFQE